MTKVCPPGKIKRSGYVRQAHERGSYTRKSTDSKTNKKIRVKGTTVAQSRVKSTCVPATGKAITRGRKTPESEKVLPKLKQDIHLSHFGYSTKNAEKTRRTALRTASKVYGDKKVLQHLSLIRNYNSSPNVKKIMSEDVKYLSIARARRLECEGKPVYSKYYKEHLQNLEKNKSRARSKTSKKSKSSKKK